MLCHKIIYIDILIINNTGRARMNFSCEKNSLGSNVISSNNFFYLSELRIRIIIL